MAQILPDYAYCAIRNYFNARGNGDTSRQMLFVCQRKGIYHCPSEEPQIVMFFSSPSMFDGMTVLFDTGSGRHRRIFNLTEVSIPLTRCYRVALLSLHAFCGCDTTSGFKGKGHQGPIKCL